MPLLSILLAAFITIVSTASAARQITLSGRWHDNGAWANSPAEVSRTGEYSAAKIVSQGFAQVFLPLPELEKDAVYRLCVVASLAGQIENISVRVRRRALPYTVFASRDFINRDNRLEADMQLRAPDFAKANDYAVYLIITGTGIVDISRVALERMDGFDLPIDHAGPRGQLLANSHFNLLDAGWSLERARIEFDARTGGRLLLRPEPGRSAVIVQSEPVVLRLGKNYQISIAGKNLAGLDVRLRGEKRATIRRFTVGSQDSESWSALFSLTPPVSGLLEPDRPAVFEITSVSNTAELESVSLFELTDESPPPLTAQAEVHAGFIVAGVPVPRAVAADRLSLTVRTSGIATGSHLIVRIRDWEGMVVHQVSRVVATLPDGTTGFLVPEIQLPLGWFDTEVAFADPARPAPFSVPGEIAVLPPALPAAAPRAASAWTLGHHLQYWNSEGTQEPRRYTLAPDADHALRTAHALGVHSVRFHPPMNTKWWHVEPEPGRWNFADELIDAPLAHDISVLGMLDGTPKFASSAPAAQLSATKGWPRNWAVYPPNDMDDWRTYVRTVVSRYRNRVRAWEIWNEPDSRMFLGMPANLPADCTPERVYTSLVRAAAEEIRKIDPDIMIVAGSVTGGGREFLVRAIRDERLLDYCDVISFHGYGRIRTADRGADAFADIVGAIERAAGGRKVAIWDTEASLGTLPEGRAGQRMAETELKGILARRAAGVSRLYFYNGFRKDDPLHADFRMLWAYRDRRPLAIQPLLAVCQWLLADAELENILRDDPDGAHVYVFRRADGRRVVAGWTSNPSASPHHPAAGLPSSGRIISQVGAQVGTYANGILPLTSSVRYFIGE